MKVKQLPEDYSFVLQLVNDDGIDDFYDLLDAMGTDRSRLEHIVSALQHKGLITSTMGRDYSTLTLSSKGQHFMKHVWPGARLRYSC